MRAFLLSLTAFLFAAGAALAQPASLHGGPEGEIAGAGESAADAPAPEAGLAGSGLAPMDAAIAAEADAGEPVEIARAFSFTSSIYDGERTYTVSLPWGYAERTGERFPVVYLVDGGAEQDLIPVAGLAALAPLTAQFREFILVGVQTDNRRYELTTPSSVPEDLEMIPDNGGADDFHAHLMTEIKPRIERAYRTSGEDAVMGESLAGLFILDTFLRSPESFDSYIAVSPSLWWNNMALSFDAAEHMARGDFAGKKLYLTIGDEGGMMQEGLDRVLAALKSRPDGDPDWLYEPMPEEGHAGIYHPAGLHALRWVFAIPE